MIVARFTKLQNSGIMHRKDKGIRRGLLDPRACLTRCGSMPRMISRPPTSQQSQQELAGSDVLNEQDWTPPSSPRRSGRSLIDARAEHLDLSELASSSQLHVLSFLADLNTTLGADL